MNAHLHPSSPYAVTSLGKLRMRAAWRAETLHATASHRLYWITRGQGRVTVGGITRGYGPNTAVFVPAGTTMAIELPAQTQGLALCLPPTADVILPPGPFHLRIIHMEAQTSLTSHIEKIERELAAHAPAMDRALKGYALLISAWAERELTRQEGAILRDKHHHLVETFMALVERHFRSGEGVAEYAARMGVTPTHLSRLCKEASGRPAHALLTDRIMHEARRLLADTDMPAREVAEHLGFSSAQYFTRAFAQSTGKTPSDFRAPPQRGPVS
jgi:AraC-like DNA-binding protein